MFISRYRDKKSNCLKNYRSFSISFFFIFKPLLFSLPPPLPLDIIAIMSIQIVFEIFILFSINYLLGVLPINYIADNNLLYTKFQNHFQRHIQWSLPHIALKKKNKNKRSTHHLYKNMKKKKNKFS